MVMRRFDSPSDNSQAFDYQTCPTSGEFDPCLSRVENLNRNELPVIGSLHLRKEFWDRHGANIVTRYKGTCGERFF